MASTNGHFEQFNSRTIDDGYDLFLEARMRGDIALSGPEAPCLRYIRIYRLKSSEQRNT